MFADVPPSVQTPNVVDAYAGGYKDDYLQELSRVRTFLSISQQNIAAQLGLTQYGRGFVHPVNVKFGDGVPAINENPYFYIVPATNATTFSQDLMVNVEAFAKRRKDSHWKEPTLRDGFQYAMTQLILNDIAGGDQEKTLPVWIQEGLAVFVAGTGDDKVKEVAQQFRQSGIPHLVGDLNSPYPYLTKAQWARYYLAIKYIVDTGGMDAFQQFLREVLNGTIVADAILHTLNQDWTTFTQNVKKYSIDAFMPFALSDDDRKLPPGAVISDPSN